jgi:hypothetical protein
VAAIAPTQWARSRGFFGRPVQEQNCGPMVVDEAYLREAVLNPELSADERTIEGSLW